MSRRRSRRRGGGPTRRTLLAGLGAGVFGVGGLFHATDTGAFTFASAPRETTVLTADDEDAVVGLTVYSPVEKNSQDPMVKVANRTGGDLTVTVSLTDCAQGTLYGPDGDSGCSVTFSLLDGNSSVVDIVAAETGTVPFDVDVSGAVSLDLSRETEAESGNVKGAVRIKYIDKFQANAQGNNNGWSIKEVKVADDDGDADLASVEYEITDSNGTIRATRTDSASGPEYKAKNVTIGPDDPSYELQSGEQYTLTVTAYDEDGNFDTETKQDTA